MKQYKNEKTEFMKSIPGPLYFCTNAPTEATRNESIDPSTLLALAKSRSQPI